MYDMKSISTYRMKTVFPVYEMPNDWKSTYPIWNLQKNTTKTRKALMLEENTL